jgi:hypothetical protein
VGDLVEWWHASLGYPVASTFLRAISAWLKNKIPGVTLKVVRKHKNRLKTITSAKGHLNQTRQGARSTTVQVPRQRRTNRDNIIVHLLSEQERNDMDIAYRLVGKYLMIFYSSGGNYIHIELLDSQNADDVLIAYKQGIIFFTERGLLPNVQRINNKSAFLTAAFQAYQADENINVDLVPPGQKRRNKAERCIETAKHHIIAVIAGCDPNFPMKAAKHHFPQIEITLNLLRPSRKYPMMSAWEQLHGEYDFNGWPLGPMGCRVLCHDKPGDRPTWGVHGTEGYYVGPTLKHYRCQTIYIPATGHTRIADTVSWHPDLLSTKSNCSLTRMEGAIAILQKAVTSISNGDVTKAKPPNFLKQQRCWAACTHNSILNWNSLLKKRGWQPCLHLPPGQNRGCQ